MTINPPQPVFIVSSTTTTSQCAPNGSRVSFANTLRGFAALFVVISHYASFFGPGREQISLIINAPVLSVASEPVPFYTFWFNSANLFSLPAFGVALFFLISGFVIPFSLKSNSLSGFCVSRVARIWPTYAAGFSITLLMLWIGMQYFSTTWPYSWREVLIHYIPGIRDLMWSRHIDFIVWTLEIEMKFYLVCALMIGWFHTVSFKVFIAPFGLFMLALCVNQVLPHFNDTGSIAWRLGTVYMGFSQYIEFMFIGTLFHYLHHGKLTPSAALLGMGLLFAMFTAQWTVGPGAAGLRTAYSYLAAWAVFALAYAFPKPFSSNCIHDFLANISYPLYVIHGVAGFVALRMLHEAGWTPLPSVALVMSGAVVLAWVLHRWVELPSQRIGRQLAQKLMRAAVR